MANIITAFRIISSVVLLFFQPFSIEFFVVYIIAGVTDMMDGAVARRLGTTSDFGSGLDTMADFALMLVCLIKILPVLNVERWMYIWLIVIAVIKAINVLSGYIVEKKMVVIHSLANKITGVLLFVLPLTIEFIDFKYSVIIVFVMVTFAAIQEGHYIRTGRKEYQ